ncbi:hypothetical protein B0H14DRAFT_3617335 [Mycena olivaceomarginata]|nr:hypothetical protein B0H14DRAFT_3617335 [Mycena olivaceomarginata]
MYHCCIFRGLFERRGETRPRPTDGRSTLSLGQSDLRTPADPAAALEDPKLPVFHHGFTRFKDEDISADTRVKPEEEEKKFARFITTELKTASEEDAKLHFQTGEEEIAALNLYPKVELKTEDESKLSINVCRRPRVPRLKEPPFSLDVPMPLSCLGEADLPEIGLKIDLVETKTVSLPQGPLPDKVCEELETNPDVGIESEGHVENTADLISESAQKMDVDHPAIETDKTREFGDKDTSSTMFLRKRRRDIDDENPSKPKIKQPLRRQPAINLPIAEDWYTKMGQPIFHVPKSHTKPGLANDTWGTWVIPQRSWALGDVNPHTLDQFGHVHQACQVRFGCYLIPNSHFKPYLEQYIPYPTSWRLVAQKLYGTEKRKLSLDFEMPLVCGNMDTHIVGVFCASLAVQKVVKDENLVQNYHIQGVYLACRITHYIYSLALVLPRKTAQGSPPGPPLSTRFTFDICGRGGFWGIEVDFDGPEAVMLDFKRQQFAMLVQAHVLEHGLVIMGMTGGVNLQGTKGNVILLAPVYNVTTQEVEKRKDVWGLCRCCIEGTPGVENVWFVQTVAKTDPQTPEYRLDQRLSKTILIKNSYTHGGLYVVHPYARTCQCHLLTVIPASKFDKAYAVVIGSLVPKIHIDPKSRILKTQHH